MGAKGPTMSTETSLPHDADHINDLKILSLVKYTPLHFECR